MLGFYHIIIINSQYLHVFTLKCFLRIFLKSLMEKCCFILKNPDVSEYICTAVFKLYFWISQMFAIS